MDAVLQTVGEGLENAFLMAWAVWWALVLGFAISAIVQAWVPRERIEARSAAAGRVRSRSPPASARPPRRARYAAIAIAKCSSRRAPRRRRALAFQFASTNLVFELGIVIWVLIGWQFTLAEFIGGLS